MSPRPQGTLQPPASIHFVHYEAEVKDHGEVTLAQVLEGADDGQEQEATHSLIPRAGTTHWFNGITPDFYDSHLAVIAVRTAHPHNAVYPKATLPEDLQLVSDLLDEIRAGWCLSSAAASTTPSPAPPSAATSPPSPPAWALSFYTDYAASRGSANSRNSQPCTPARTPLPVLEIHGGSDTTCRMRAGRGEGGTEPAIPDWLSWWAARNGCTAANTTETPETGTYTTRAGRARRGRACCNIGRSTICPTILRSSLRF
ncbi:hypothetical protein B0H14DRAFT_3569400 [Mycena olivaceomarginata]|nr:hypothetical protein B0H14DRAFT_3569400 [Mycena olivaceomarginata]